MVDSDGGSPPAPQREADDDHDLLTYSEAGVRLHETLVEQRARVSELEAAGEGPALTAARARLAALEDAARRNTRQPINDENFERFFGYKGTARRNT